MTTKAFAVKIDPELLAEGAKRTEAFEHAVTNALMASAAFIVQVRTAMTHAELPDDHEDGCSCAAIIADADRVLAAILQASVARLNLSDIQAKANDAARGQVEAAIADETPGADSWSRAASKMTARQAEQQADAIALGLDRDLANEMPDAIAAALSSMRPKKESVQ